VAWREMDRRIRSNWVSIGCWFSLFVARALRGVHGRDSRLDISADVKRKANHLVLAIYAIFQETKSDWTTFEGSFEETFYDVNLQHPGWRILSIQGNFHQVYQTVLNGTGQHTISPFGTSEFVNNLVLVGDSDGGTFGGDDKPRIVKLGFNKIELKLIK
jgi:hypothetical protein